MATPVQTAVVPRPTLTFRRRSGSLAYRFELLVLIAATAAGGCEANPPTSPAEAAPEARLGVVTQSVARALAHRDVRDYVVEEMRRSPWNEHKVLLHEVLDGEGNVLLAQSAAAARMDPSAFRALVGSLPELDFYMPVREQRRTWTADVGSATVIGLVEEPTAIQYDEKGQRLPTVDLNAGAVFVLHPAEPKSYRTGRRATYVPGQVIDDPEDGEGGLVIEITDRAGRRFTLDVGKERMPVAEVGAHLEQVLRTWESEGTSVMGAGGGSAASWKTGLTFLQNERIDDGPLGNAEIEFKAWHTPGNCCEVKFRWDDVDLEDYLVKDQCPASGEPGYHALCHSGFLIYWSNWYPIGSSNRVLGQVYETDSGPDQMYGSHSWYGGVPGDNGALRSYFGFISGGNANCLGGGQLACAAARVSWQFF